jgi:hypothetical protein
MGSDSIYPSIHDGHFVIAVGVIFFVAFANLLNILGIMYEAHQKHDWHIRKYISEFLFFFQ